GSSVRVRNLRRSRLPAALIIALRTRLAFFGPHSWQAQHLHPKRVYRHAELGWDVISPRSAHRPQLLLFRLRPTTSSEEGHVLSPSSPCLEGSVRGLRQGGWSPPGRMAYLPYAPFRTPNP